jgi:hypothetical protein
MTREKIGVGRRLRQGMPSIAARLQSGKLGFNRGEMRAGNMLGAMESRPNFVVGQIMATVENHPRRIFQMKGQRFSANEHGWSENRFATEEARKIISLLGKSDSDRSPFLLSWPELLARVCHLLDDKPRSRLRRARTRLSSIG